MFWVQRCQNYRRKHVSKKKTSQHWTATFHLLLPIAYAPKKQNIRSDLWLKHARFPPRERQTWYLHFLLSNRFSFQTSYHRHGDAQTDWFVNDLVLSTIGQNISNIKLFGMNPVPSKVGKKTRFQGALHKNGEKGVSTGRSENDVLKRQGIL